MDPAYEDLELDRIGTDGRVGRITLNRPEVRNALSKPMLAELRNALAAWEADESIRVIVLRGAGPSFCAGYDMSNSSSAVHQYTSRDEEGRILALNLRADFQQVTDFQLFMWNLGKVIVAQVHGHCIAGGCELAMMADLVVAAEDARIGHPGVRGIGFPRNGAMWPLLIGMRQAKELALTGDSISGVQAAEMGMINYAWPAEELEVRTLAYADRLALMHADHLAAIKVGCNRWYENMGLYSSLRSNTELDVLAQSTREAYAWRDAVRRSRDAGNGLRDAIRWRDERYDQPPLPQSESAEEKA